MRLFVFVFAIVLLAACDPAYHLTYAVVNDSSKAIYCVDKTKSGAASVQVVLPDSTIEVYSESGFGKGKVQFRESKPDVESRFSFFSDSTLSDSCVVKPRKGWRYYPLPIGAYNARIYIRSKDIK